MKTELDFVTEVLREDYRAFQTIKVLTLCDILQEAKRRYQKYLKDNLNK